MSTELADRFTAMIGELRAMDDVTGGGTVLPLAEQQFGLVADLLDRASYDESTGRRFHVVLAELGQLCGWCGYDAGQQGLRSGTTSRPCARRTAPMTGRWVHTSSGRWPIRPRARGSPQMP